MRRFEGSDIVIASFNKWKSKELVDLVAEYVPNIQFAGDLGAPEPDETGMTFADNARLKALSAARATGKPAIADDSGLVVEALNGAPGIYSARWGGPTRDFGAAMQRVLTAVGDNPNRNALFVSALSLAWPDGHDETVEGRVHGTLSDAPRGEKGFGYDPIFIPKAWNMTFGEMEPKEKHAISHRADAWRKLLARCFT
jgi:XTP/dITP diphosphohydrolase